MYEITYILKNDGVHIYFRGEKIGKIPDSAITYVEENNLEPY